MVVQTSFILVCLGSTPNFCTLFLKLLFRRKYMNTLELLKNEASLSLTENGAVTLSTTQSDCLDLFALGGALRDAEETRVQNLFMKAYMENPDQAVKILFYLRDIRGGLGERKTFRTMLKTLAETHKESVIKNIKYIAEFGRYDDLLCLLETPAKTEVLKAIKEMLLEDEKALKDGKPVSLLAKWLPSINASDKSVVKTAKKIADFMGMNCAQYRKLISALRENIKIIENNLRTKDYSFDYEKQTSKSLFKYRKAFARNDAERYGTFMKKVEKGEASLKTGCLYPYEVISPMFRLYENFSEEEQKVMDTTWNHLENFAGDKNALVVCDVSGSMFSWGSPSPIQVSVSLAIYFAERNKGLFHNHFITFHDKPSLIEIKGNDIVDKVDYVRRAEWGDSTNIEAVFDLILRTAVKNKLSQEEMPEKIYIISDMEFDCCAKNSDLTNFENAKRKFVEAGYKLPGIVFWNVQSRQDNLPISKNEQGVTLVSGASPRLFAMLKDDTLNPYEFMLSVIGNERYAKIVA